MQESLTVKDCQELWELLHWWQLLYSMQVRARVGLKHYPVHAREEKKAVKSEFEMSDTESDDQEKERKKKSKRKKSKTMKGALDAEKPIVESAAADEEKTESLVTSPTGQEKISDGLDTEDGIEAHLLKIHRAAEMAAQAGADSIEGSPRADFDDASTILSVASSVGGRENNSKNGISAPVEADEDDLSINSTPSLQGSKAKAISAKVTNTKSEKGKDEEKSSSGGFFSGLTKIFGGPTAPAPVEEVHEEEEQVQLISSITTNNGNGVCEWAEVCKLLGCECTPEKKDITLLGACKAVLALLRAHSAPKNGDSADDENAEFGVLKACCTFVDVNDLMMGINELLPTDFTNPWVESVMIKLTNNIGQVVHARFIESLRHYEKWQKNLENIRKDRIKKQGGSLKDDAEGQTEVDKHGQIRIIPNSDQIVDTDIVHGNSQRSQISVVMPILEVKLAKILVECFELEGELACCVQFGFILVAPYIQRVIRGTLGRMRRNLRRFDSAYYSLHMATVTLQGWCRAIAGRKSYAAKKAAIMGNIKEAMAILCQKSIRMFIHANKYRRYIKKKKDASEWFAITMFQAMIRGFNARHRTKKIKAAHQAEKQAEMADYGVRLLQRWARGCIARRTIIRSLKVRKSLSKDVLLLGEKYLASGDLWSFLKVIDDKFSVLQKEIKENQEKEDEFAATFVNKVLAKRQGDFDGAWDRFSNVTKKNTAELLGKDTLTAVGEVSKTPWGPGQSPVRSGTGGGIGIDGAYTMGNDAMTTGGSTINTDKSNSMRGKKGKEQSGKMKSTKGQNTVFAKTGAMGAGMDTSVPGPLLRRAVSATVMEGVTREKLSQRVDVDPMDYPGSNKQRKEAEKLKKSNSTVKMVNGKPVRDKAKKGAPPPKGKMYATTTDWAWAVATGTMAGEPEAPPPEPRKVQPGESVLVDVPKGLDDTMERLIHAVSLKTYIPEFSNCSTCDEAYQLYLRMPKGLAKMRYEIEAHKWCQPQINKLRIKGVHKIRDALPMNKFRQMLNNLEVPLEVVGVATQWVRLLLAMGDIPAGKVHPETAQREADVKAGIGTVAQLKNVGLKSTDGSPLKAEVRAVKLADGTTIYQADDGSSPDAMGTETVMLNGVAVSIERKPLIGEEDTAGKVLLSLVEGGEWAGLTSSAEDLLLHAAFLVVPHVTTHTDKFGTREEFSEMGHLAFKAHTKSLQFMATEDERREAIRKRFRAALLLATPFALRLKADGIQTVKDLMDRAEVVAKMNLPPQMHTQVESMLSTAVGAAVSAKQAPTIRDHCDTAATTFTVPMIYDNKFQRGPFDPYGKPPRFIAPANLKSNKDRKLKAQVTATLPAKQAGMAAEDEEDEDDELDNRGLWDKTTKRNQHNLTIKNAQQLYSLQTANQHISQEEKDEEEAIRKEMARREAEGAMAVQEDEYALLEREAARNRDSTAAKRARLLMHDFEARVRAGFERPFKCRFEGCTQAFSRAYTLKIHEKSHKLFGNYHNWKRNPQLFLDKDKESMAQEAHELAESRTMLPPIVRADIDALKESISAKALALNTFSELESKYSFSTTSESEKELSFKLDACRWPTKRAPVALEALNDLPPSRGPSRENSPSIYERPYSGENAFDGGVHAHQNWGLGSQQHLRGQEISLSRGSRRAKRGGTDAAPLSPALRASSLAKGNTSKKSKARSGSAGSTSPVPDAPRVESPSYARLRDRLEQARAQSPMFRALASREKLTSKGNIPPVDSLRSLLASGDGRSHVSSREDSLELNKSGEWAAFSEEYLTDFQEVNAGFASSFSRPSTVDPNNDNDLGSSEIGLTVRFGHSLVDDDDDGDAVGQLTDPFERPYDLA